MAGIIHLRFLALIYLSFLPYLSLAVGPSPGPNPGESSPAAPAPTPSPDLSEGQNSAPVNLNICNGDINIYNYKDCTFYGNSPGADGARPPPAGDVEGGGGRGFPGGDNVVTVTVTEYVTKTKIVYAKGPAPATPQAGDGQVDAGIANRNPDPASEPSGPTPEPEPQSEPMPDVNANANADAYADVDADTEADPNIDPSNQTPLDAADQYAAKVKAYNDANAFADEFSDGESKDIAHRVSRYWGTMREKLCRVCIAIVDEINQEVSEEEQRDISEAFGAEGYVYNVAKNALDEIYESSYGAKGKIPESKWGDECTKVIREYIFDRGHQNRANMLSRQRAASRTGDAKEYQHQSKRLDINDIFLERIRSGFYDMSCKKEEQLDKVISMWIELNKKQKIIKFGGEPASGEKTSFDQRNNRTKEDNGDDDEDEENQGNDESDDWK